MTRNDARPAQASQIPTPRLQTPQTRCRAAVARLDITPPVGIYHRMWGAALHDRATGVHRPLTATMLRLEPVQSPHGTGSTDGRIITAIDHCLLDSVEMLAIRLAIAEAAGLPVENVLLCLSHTHGSGWMSRSRSGLPGGEKIGPYLDELAASLGRLAAPLGERLEPATLLYGTGRCGLAKHRDHFDKERGQFVCGLNPEGPADDTLLVARLVATEGERAGRTLATLVNYACHPTTLAWDNTLISPDWIGAMREVIEREEGGSTLFLQGASGDLGPREGFVGDTAVADRNGREIGYAALAALTPLPSPGTEYVYRGPVVSGATLGTWTHQPLAETDLRAQQRWEWTQLDVELPYRADLPRTDETTAERERWTAEEARARAEGDEVRLRDCRARVEQCSRQLARLAALQSGPGWKLPVTIGFVGDAVWIFVPGELYQVFQTTLRSRCAGRPILVTTMANDWQPGYIPPASAYGQGIYQEVIAATAPGALEALIEAVERRIEG